jgi:Domain of unknown function (DUF4440)
MTNRNKTVLMGMLLIPLMHKTSGDASRSQTEDADRAAVVAVENDWLSHLSDGPSLNRILADDFVHPVPNGLFLNKPGHIKWAVEHPRPAGWRARFEKLEVRVYGATAIANGIVETNDNAEAQPRKTIFTDVFVYRDNRWQAVNAQENEIANGR